MSTAVQAGNIAIYMSMSSVDGMGAGDVTAGPMATIDRLKAQLQKIFSEMRDLERTFNEQMQRIAYDRQIGALETKREAIGLNFDAAMASAVAQIIGGLVSTVGAASGQRAVAATEGLSKAGQGIGGVTNASFTREAQQKQLQGDFESQTADVLQKELASTVERAAEASRQMREALRDLMMLQGQIASAVRY